MKKLILAFLNNKKTFNGIDLIRYVKEMTNKKHIYDDTVLRCLRHLREENQINYICICKKQSKYELI